MKKYFKILYLLLSVSLYAQNNKFIILDRVSNKPLNEIQIFSGNGSLIGNSNAVGEFTFELTYLQQQGIKSIMIYNVNYSPVEFNINEIPKTVYLEKVKSYNLEPVVITQKLSKKYFTIKGYVRSWKLINNKLVRYGDGLLEYHIPYENSNNNFATGIKNYAKEYRTFKTDSIKQKSRIISIHGFDSFFDYQIHKKDILGYGNYYNTELVKDSLYNVLQNGKKVGSAIINNNNVTETYVKESFEGDEAVKILLWKLSASYTSFEKWIGEGETKHLSYSFSNEKKMVKTKTEGKYNAEETINEIFIEDEIIYNDIKPQKSKTYIDSDRSYYATEYWKEQIKKHPLPKSISEQLINVNENKNLYK